MVAAVESVLVSGSTLSLTCSISPYSVDTPFIIQSNWTTPEIRHDRINDDNDTNAMLGIHNVETADSGVYSCTARAIDTSGSQYIISSVIHNDTVDIIVSKSFLLTTRCSLIFCLLTELKVSLSAVYTPAPGEQRLGPNEFTAGSDLNLTCDVEGNSGSVMYSWSVRDNSSTPECTATECNIDVSSTTSTLTVGRPPLLSYYAGNYTCSASETDRPNSDSSDEFAVVVVGKQ